MSKNFRVDNYDYLQDENGIHQLNPQPFVYDEKYCATYNTDAYVRGNEILQALRLGFVIGSHGSIPKSLVDIGYGNGAFLKRCRGVIDKLYGKDISGIVIDFVENVWHYPKCDVATFHDCIEHIQDLSFLYDIPVSTIIISLPYCHFNSIEWFEKWKHRKPNEHVHHFDKYTLASLMSNYKWRAVAISHHEDIVRIGVDNPNTLTMAFKRY